MTQEKVKDAKHFKTSGLEIIYTLFLSLLIALFFGLGISAFYTSPKEPDYPTILQMPNKETSITQDQINAQIKYDKEIKQFQSEFSIYNRNVSIATLILAIIALAVSLIFLDNIYIISNGLLLGGVFTQIYSMVRGFMTDDAKYRFVIVSVGLLIALALGYIKFIKPKAQKKVV